LDDKIGKLDSNIYMRRRQILNFGSSGAIAGAFGIRSPVWAGDNIMMAKSPVELRSAVIGLRSFAGSRHGFLWAAEILAAAQNNIRLYGVSSVLLYPASGDSPAYLAASILIESRLSVDELVLLAKALETKLADPEATGPRLTLRAELLWVEKVEIKSAKIELPSPALFTSSWAIRTFAEAAGGAVKDNTQKARFNEALKNVPGPRPIDQLNLEASTPELLRTAKSDQWISTDQDWPDSIAAAARLVGIALADAEAESKGIADSIPNRAASKASAIVDTTRPELVVGIQGMLSHSMNENQILRVWVDTVQNELRQREMLITTAVVFQVNSTTIRGLLFGAKAALKPKLIDITAIDVDRDPADLRAAVMIRKIPKSTRITLTVDRLFTR
jgi:7,8-dihydro-6-hydroxymethylpterin-pyrophosphokinase